MLYSLYEQCSYSSITGTWYCSKLPTCVFTRILRPYDLLQTSKRQFCALFIISMIVSYSLRASKQYASPLASTRPNLVSQRKYLSSSLLNMSLFNRIRNKRRCVMFTHWQFGTPFAKTTTRPDTHLKRYKSQSFEFSDRQYVKLSIGKIFKFEKISILVYRF
jgi:hypothetical protein